MKFKFSLALVAILSLLSVSSGLKANLKATKAAEQKSLDVQKVQEYKDFFWVQKIDPSRDAIVFLKNTERQNYYKYVIVSAEAIALTNSVGSMNNIESEIFLRSIYDKDRDDAPKGKCCSRIKYYVYDPVKCVGEQCIEEEKRQKLFPPTEQQLNLDPNLANKCLEIYIYENNAWRICHRTEDSILKLKQTITYGVLRTQPGINEETLVAQFIANSKSTPVTAPVYWDWHDQTKWGGNCDSGIMQSPINVLAPDPSPEAKTDQFFAIDYKFNDKLPVTVKLNSAEIYLDFTDFAGGVKIEYGNGKMLSYFITKLFFRFPAEHLINGYRLDGEIVLKGLEVTQNNNQALAITHGLEFVIPIQFNPNAPIYPEIDNLNPDMWRSEVAKNGQYIPKNPLTGNAATMDLGSFMTKVMGLKSDFSIYLGSSTTPPCEDHVYQIISNTPLLMANCQFKTLRENTLKSDSLKETHARNLQINPYGGLSGLKNVKFEQMKALTNLNQLAPEREIQNIVASKNPTPDGSPAKKVESKVAKKEKVKEAAKALFRTNVSCDLERTYNPPNPPKQPEVTK